MTIPLIPRKVFFGNPDKASVQISPDGAHISYLAPLDGVLNVWVAPTDNPGAARAITHDTGRGIRYYEWAFTNSHILYIQDKNGDENWRLYSVNTTSGAVLDLTPCEGVQARPMKGEPEFPEEIIIGLNNRNPQLHDLYRLNLTTGVMTLLLQNEGFMDFLIRDDYQVGCAMRMTPEGGLDLLKPAPGGGWQPWDTIPAEDMLTTGALGFDQTGQILFIKDSRGRNTSALMAQNFSTAEKVLLAENPLADVEDVLRHPTQKNIQAISFIYERKRWIILDEAITPDLDYLRSVADGDVEVVSRTLDDRLWIVVYMVDDGPVRFYLYDRVNGQAHFLFTNRKELEGLPLAKMHPVTIQTSDRLDMVVYYSLPVGSDSNGDGIPDQPLPMVISPHGGPWGRDYWGLNPWHQWLANRGYAVLSMNFRASTGFGKSFINAGNLQWGERIIGDQFDAVQWAIQQGIADPQRVGVCGGSFGGYSTLAALTFYPETYACGVDLFGPANLITLLESMPPYWKPMLEMFTTRVGDHRTEEGRALLKKHSPLTYVERICHPLLIGQGANDARVKQAESDQIVQAMQSKKIPVTYVLYPDEGHGFARPENNLSFNAISEVFLAKQLGGRFQPIGDDLKGSSLQVLTGKEDIPGLPEALSASHF
jgi:dipeptidyl aminopeptidase/acylaminoacyl peptidase